MLLLVYGVLLMFDLLRTRTGPDAAASCAARVSWERSLSRFLADLDMVGRAGYSTWSRLRAAAPAPAPAPATTTARAPGLALAPVAAPAVGRGVKGWVCREGSRVRWWTQNSAT